MNDYAETQKNAHCKNIVRSFFVNNDFPSDSRVLCDQIDFIYSATTVKTNTKSTRFWRSKENDSGLLVDLLVSLVDLMEVGAIQ